MKKKMWILVFLVIITILNLLISVPLILDTCTCYRSGQIYCTGDCCGGPTRCDCHSVGADNCRPLI